MKLQQLRYAVEVYRQNLNVSEAAEVLFTSQPGISKQIRMLEEELGVPLFIRHGKRMVAVTAPGKIVLETAERILREVQNIKQIGTEFADQNIGSLTIATTHTLARYDLPEVVSAFVKRYPQVQLNIQTASPKIITHMVLDGEVDFAIGMEIEIEHPELRKLSCGAWNRSIIVPDNHPLLSLKRPLRLEDIAAYPLITYDIAFSEESKIARAFAQEDCNLPRVVLASADTDVIKTYVAQGLGIGLLASMAFDSRLDQGLQLISAEHLFEPSFSQIILRQDVYLRGFGYEFLALFAPGLTRARIESALHSSFEEDFSI
ncbi:MAG: CysB family HTH-type transcriptional regulator [Snodgrassella sp.]|jgi:LysR family transcriptional regulator, cys regulon transcriptional activator|uniref:Transcriptional regulator CysB n=1 Tax=Snodgrassella alvi TaxID=1196083 RepID=A0A2N9XTH3_9NEIS|nr:MULTISPECIES: CysB family HTH-type transcriptional regulator [Snodgrassella]MCO6514449.1 CysB family HTH-type transcriptional regulator [Snodgrassella sp.]MCO6519538.1 CysB family HTH-type transcriptional regulator [Snodgrassella sp.]MCO6522786.1 CysB family HTH-type transcriptional regulator [Snodgrassella sp.]PIT07367.1 transcriptional regulator CysB [Snodgrassella communis]PIT52536.1 transcriptional regulator CysB [Snodgrassella communis]